MNELDIMTASFEDELQKIARAELNKVGGLGDLLRSRNVQMLGLGAAGALSVDQANKDRRLGRQIRMQQRG